MRDSSDPPSAELSVRERAPGLLWAYAGSAGGAARPLSAVEIPAALAGREWVWVHADLIDQRVHAWLAGLCGFGPGETMTADPETGLALQQSDGGFRGVGADFHMDFLRVSDSIGRFGFSVSERLLVTGWRHPLASIDAVRNALKGGARYPSAFGILAAVVTAFGRAAETRVRAAETKLDAVEDQLLATRARDERGALKEVRRLALALHRPVAAMTALLRDAAESEEGEALPHAGAAAVAEMMARLGALDQAILQLTDRAKLLQDEMAAELADESNRSLRALTVMTGLLLPGSLIAGIFGMNTGGLPFQDSAWGSLGAVVIAAVATVIFYRVLVRLGASLGL